MTTATEATATAHDPNVQSVDDYERSTLEIPEGIFRFRLAGAYGLLETKNGKKYLNARFLADQQAHYDENGMLTGATDLKRPHSTFIKFFIENEFGTRRFNSWLNAVGYETEGTFDPASQRYVFMKDAALSETTDRTAWTRVRHKNDETYGWQIEISDFTEKPQSRIRVNGETT